MLQTENPLPKRNGRLMELYFCWKAHVEKNTAF